MADRFASARKALGICDVCGFEYKLRQLKDLIEKGRNTHIKACPECWNPVGVGRDPYDLTPNDLVGTGSVGTVTIVTS